MDDSKRDRRVGLMSVKLLRQKADWPPDGSAQTTS
jgi:hypothetical protein